MITEPSLVELRYLEIEDYLGLKDSMQKAYPHWEGSYWRKHHIEKLLKLFPEGQLAVVMDGQVVGCALSLIVNYDKFGDHHT